MAFVGPVAGALVAGGVYYGFSNLIQTRTEQLRTESNDGTPYFAFPGPHFMISYSLHVLSSRLVDSPTLANAPPSAASRITSKPWATYAESRWNQEIAYLFAGFHEWDRRASEWGRKVLYGEQKPTTDKS
ncbi:hypothetical protein NP233_g9920 [Leucocoprinus birnbaumii]|uniref:Uncharacterized protein n=1 Tax=Leucocoprinus birnbaumii TaxID=56174 RepID=A0AAD5VJZ6_9AGAR|nr:hypothetical protein NP233_g9920 [Leucocoprinus birnbaumii]